MLKLSIYICFLAFVLGCSSKQKPRIEDSDWPRQPNQNEYLVIVASGKGYAPSWEFYEIGPKHQKVKLNFRKCTYFYFDRENIEIEFRFRGMDDNFPESSFFINNAKLGETLYFKRELMFSHDKNDKIFYRSNKNEISEICGTYGFKNEPISSV